MYLRLVETNQYNLGLREKRGLISDSTGPSVRVSGAVRSISVVLGPIPVIRVFLSWVAWIE